MKKQKIYQVQNKNKIREIIQKRVPEARIEFAGIWVDVYMIPDARCSEFYKFLQYGFREQLRKQKLNNQIVVLTHTVSSTKKYYPKQYEKYKTKPDTIVPRTTTPRLRRPKQRSNSRKQTV